MRHHFYLDIHVIKIIFQRGWNIVAGAVTVIFMPHWFTQVEQGYYYTFLSLLALQVFFEMGFNSVIGQFVAHEFALLNAETDRPLSDNKVTEKRLQAMLMLVLKWYSIISIAFFIVVSFSGYFFFNKQAILPISNWLIIWLALTLFTSINLFFSPYLTILEAIGHVGEIAQLRAVQSMIGYLLMWLLLSFGFGLKAVPVVPAVAFLLTAFYVNQHRAFLQLDFFKQSEKENIVISWRHEILPMQWRIALSWMSGYLIFQAFTPLIFTFQGAVEAGQVGLSFSIFNALSVLGMSWASSAMPQMTKLIALKKRVELNVLFNRVVKSVVASTALITGSFLISILGLNYFSISLVSRLPHFYVLICMAFVTVVNSYIFTAATYMRAHKEEPMLLPSVCVGLLILVSTYFASHVSVLLAIMMYTVITIGVSFPWTLVLMKRYQSR